MNSDEKKLMIFKSDCDSNEPLGNLSYVKFLGEAKRYAIFYLPLVAPKNLKDYLRENGIVEAYEVRDEKVLQTHSDMVYTFRKESGVYEVSKGIELSKKRILLVDRGMNLKLDLPAYSYEMVNDSFYVSPLKEGDIERSFCYVVDEDEINPVLRNIMLPVTEAIPGVLSVNTYPFAPVSNAKKLKNPLT